MRIARRAGAGVAAVAVAMAFGTTANAEAAGTFSGTCTFKTPRVDSDPLGIATPAPTRTLRFRANGTCTGSVNGTAVTGAPARLASDITGRITCFGSEGELRGPASIAIGGTVLKLQGTLVKRYVEFAFTFTGASGAAGGISYVDFVADILQPPLHTTILACPFGGATHGQVTDLKVTTSSPLVSLP